MRITMLIIMLAVALVLHPIGWFGVFWALFGGFEGGNFLHRIFLFALFGFLALMVAAEFSQGADQAIRDGGHAVIDMLDAANGALDGVSAKLIAGGE